MQEGKGLTPDGLTEVFDPRRSMAFVNDPKTQAALSALSVADPGWTQRLKGLMNGMQTAQKSVMAAPGSKLTQAAAEATTPGGGSLGDYAVNMGGSILGNRLIGPMLEAGGAGTIQAHAQAANIGRRIAGGVFGGLKGQINEMTGRAGIVSDARDQLANALQNPDPAPLKQLLGTAPQAVAQAAQRNPLMRVMFGSGQPIPHGSVWNQPWFRATATAMSHSILQGGSEATRLGQGPGGTQGPPVPTYDGPIN